MGSTRVFSVFLPALSALSLVVLLISMSGGTEAPARASSEALQVYFIDVEGGQATLFVTPAHESLLIDAGWPGHEGRDADRIAQAARRAGVLKLDYVLITHYHDDHVGGVPQLVARIPVGTFIDHGPNRETTDVTTEHNWEEYQKVLAGHVKRLTVRAEDKLPLKGLDVTIVSADGEVTAKSLGSAGAGARVNELCAGAARYPTDTTENLRSLGILAVFGKLRILDLGDLTADKERELMCPANRLGKIDVFIVSHHGFDQSNSPVLVKAITPRVAIMDNGAEKGGSASVVDTIRSTPDLETLWQLHYAQAGGSAHNTDAAHIANLQGAEDGNYVVLTANLDGSMEVLNSRTKLSQHYYATP